MRFLRFVQIGSSNNTLIHNLVYNLNYVQSAFRFSFNDDVIAYQQEINIEQPIAPATLERLVAQYVANRCPDEYPIGICDCLLEDELFASYDDKEALITTFGWTPEFSPHPLQSGISYALVDVLLSLYMTLPIHYETKGCPVDYCDIKGDINVGLAKCDFCFECRSEILRAVGRGQIALQQVAAVYKILDLIAGRKVCFVLMPFDKRFDTVYAKCIKPILTSHNWQCCRADEVYEPREIVNLIQEQILRADLVIADLTGRNANVFYELGYAHAVGKNTVLLTQSISEVPFDLRHRQLIEYNATPQGRKRLADELKNCLTCLR